MYLIVYFSFLTFVYSLKRKKIIKKFITLSRAKDYFNTLSNTSDDVIFETKIENGKECKFEIGLVEMSTNQSAPVYMVDEFGRNIKIKLEKNFWSKIMNLEKEIKQEDIDINKI